MTNKKINDFNPISALALDTNFEVQDAVGGPGSSKKASGQQIVDLVKSELVISNIKYVSMTGDDSTGDGSEFNPWATLEYAYSQVTGTALAPVLINVMTGKYVFATVDNVKPFVQVDFNYSEINITSSSNLDVSWSGFDNGYVSWRNISKSNFGLNWDFNTAGALNLVVELSNIHCSSNNWVLKGSGGLNNCSLYINNINSTDVVSFASININSQDFNAIIKDGILYAFVFSSILGSARLLLKNTKINGTYTINNDNVTASPDMAIELNSCELSNISTYNNTGSGILDIFETDIRRQSTLSFNNTGSGTNNIYFDRLTLGYTSTGINNFIPIAAPYIFGKVEVWGQSIDPSVIDDASDTAPTLTPNGSSMTIAGFGIGAADDTGIVTNNTGKAGFFHITSRISFLGITTPGDFLITHHHGAFGIVSSQTNASSSLTTYTEATIESDVYLQMNESVQLFMRSLSGAPRTIQVFGLTTRMNMTI